MSEQLYIGEPRDVYIGTINGQGTPVLTTGGITNRDTGVAVNNAVVTAQVRESGTIAATAVGGSVTCTYVATSSGHYLGTIPAATTLLLTDGTEYNVWVTSASGEVYRKLVYRAGYRGAK